MGTPAMIGLGSNLGDRWAILDAAVAGLAGTPGVRLRSVSSYYETRPVGGPAGQGSFLNAAAAIETTLSPLPLLRALQEIEREAGRVRSVRWGERTLDLDLLLFGSNVLDEPNLKVPHPWLPFRRFVLAPLAEIAPGAVEPETGRSIFDLLANLDRRPSRVALLGFPDEEGWSLFRRLVSTLGAVSAESLEGCPREVALSGPWVVTHAESIREQWPDLPLHLNLSTFIAAPAGSIQDVRGRLEGIHSGFKPQGLPPILACPEGEEDRAFAEILTACAASRGGLEPPET